MILLFLFLCNSYHIHESGEEVAMTCEIQMRFSFYFSFPVSVMYKKPFEVTNRIRPILEYQQKLEIVVHA